MKAGTERPHIEEVSALLTELGYVVNPIYGVEKTVIGAVGGSEHDKVDAADRIRAFDGVEDVIFVTKPYKFVARESRPDRSVMTAGPVRIGGPEPVLMAGPCTVEDEQQLFDTAARVRAAGATVLRGGAYKPCTSPYSFQGMGTEGLRLLRAAADANGLQVITEVMHVGRLDEVCQYADILQVGTRNMQNYDLLTAVGSVRKPVMLKRGMSAKYEEWLLAAEYIASGGNEQIMLCERGIRTFEPYTRNTLDLAAIPALRSLSHLPIIVDPSQGTGRRELVPAMSLASIAAGADGLIIEVHPDPDHAIKDGAQSITLEAFEALVPQVRRVKSAAS